MKKQLLFPFLLSAFFFLPFPFFHAQAQTTIPAGNVSGTWALAGSPYQIQGAIQIPTDSTLTIQPGVTVDFQGFYRLQVQGRLLAIGTVTDTIIFTAADTANGWNSIRFDNLTTNNDTSKIIFCKLQYAKATGTSPYDKGGALYFNNWSKAIISYCSIKHCTATDAGGAIYCEGSGISISYNTISNNSCVGTNSGGGITSYNSSPIISNNTIIYNSSIGYEGGGIMCSGSGTPMISDNIISYNSTNNGGGIMCDGAASPIISNNIISYNLAIYNGGGICCFNNSNPDISNNIISNNNVTNSSYGGGGICCYNSSNPNISNNTITNNSSTTNGGGISCDGSSPAIVNTTITNNSADNGGALYCTNNADPILINTILWGNTASTSGPQVSLFDDPSDPGFDYCDVQGSNTAFFINGNFYTGIYQNNINTDPLFTSPSGGAGTGFNGLTADWSLQSTSPCINAGTPDTTGLSLPATDLAGNPRVIACRVDMGAYEFQSGTPLLASITQTQQILCYGDTSAAISASISGGNSPYTYLWTNNLGDTIAQNDSVINGISAGTYTVTVTDASSCTATDSATITEPAALVVATSAINVSCGGICDGTATATLPGGCTPQTYVWSNGESTASITGICSGTYTFTATNCDGCSVVDSVVISEPSELTISLSTTDASCSETDGSATVTASGGTSPYDYQWSSGDTTATADSLSSGIYMVSVTDALGCQSFAAAMISDANGPSITVNAVTQVSCNGNNDGSITLTTSGGSTPYNYEWSNGSTTEDISGLVAGPYEVSITDASGCVATKSIPVIQPDVLDLTLTEVNASCGSPDGSASVNVTGGTSPYSYLWSTAETSNTTTGLIWGIYTVTVTDANGCTKTANAAIAENGGAVVVVDSISPAGCGGSGGIYITVTGNASPFIYQWTDISTFSVGSSEDLTGVGAGTYDLIITDTNGCMGAASAIVEDLTPQPLPICLVTVDTVTGTNKVVWQKDTTDQSVAQYNIYKESTQAGVYYLVGSVMHDSLSVFTDPISNPLIRSWRYKITTVDTCGIESDFSDEHKTIHLVLSDFGGNNYLTWDDYEGFSFGTYYIYRFSSQNGWEVIDSLPSNLNSFTDTSAGGLTNMNYFVEAKPPSICSATKTAENYNSSRSNVAQKTNPGSSPVVNFVASATNITPGSSIDFLDQSQNNPSGWTWLFDGGNPAFSTTQNPTGIIYDNVGCFNVTLIATNTFGTDTLEKLCYINVNSVGIAENDETEMVSVYPNPSKGIFTIKIQDSFRLNRNKIEDIDLDIFDALGQQVTHEKLLSSSQTEIIIDISHKSSGIYYLQVISDTGVTIRKIVLE
ncbi:MAG: hypothetical protein COA57_05985 [Flavobacteriales bacterium]|nr:MAG: hypothetical protein COA57_05985 [Flavobacteriales bacterium]